MRWYRCDGFCGQVCRAGEFRSGNKNRRVSEVYVDGLEVPMVLWGHVEGWGRDEGKERAAEVILAGINSVLIKIIPGVFALIHRESIFLRVQEYRRRELGSRRWRGRVLRWRRRVEMIFG